MKTKCQENVTYSNTFPLNRFVQMSTCCYLVVQCFCLSKLHLDPYQTPAYVSKLTTNEIGCLINYLFTSTEIVTSDPISLFFKL